MILNTSKNKWFSKEDLGELLALCTKYNLNVTGIRIVKNEDLEWHGAVACFSVLHPNTIYICDDQPDMARLIPYIAHELVHRKQCMFCGINLYLFLARPWWRKWTIERRAYKVEDRLRKEISTIK